jgi:hypothetical protein
MTTQERRRLRFCIVLGFDAFVSCQDPHYVPSRISILSLTSWCPPASRFRRWKPDVAPPPLRCVGVSLRCGGEALVQTPDHHGVAARSSAAGRLFPSDPRRSIRKGVSCGKCSLKTSGLQIADSREIGFPDRSLELYRRRAFTTRVGVRRAMRRAFDKQETKIFVRARGARSPEEWSWTCWKADLRPATNLPRKKRLSETSPPTILPEGSGILRTAEQRFDPCSAGFDERRFTITLTCRRPEAWRRRCWNHRAYSRYLSRIRISLSPARLSAKQICGFVPAPKEGDLRVRLRASRAFGPLDEKLRRLTGHSPTAGLE